MLNVKIFECIYSSAQQSKLNGATRLYLSNDHPERRELQAYVEIYKQKLFYNADLTGVFSPKFEIKCMIPLSEFVGFCEVLYLPKVCHINPFPYLSYWSFNVWEQGELAHPGLKNVAQFLLDSVGIDLNIFEVPRQDKNVQAYCNFWIGNQDFWNQYVGTVLVPISDFMDQNPLHPAVIAILRDTNHTDRATFLPFMIERLYSTWLASRSVDFVSYNFLNDFVIDRLCLTDFNRLLYKQMKRMVDEADFRGEFPIELRKRMSDMCELYQQHIFDYFATRPHPHTGRVLSRIL